MPPSVSSQESDSSSVNITPQLLEMASLELDRLKANGHDPKQHAFPPACHAMLMNIEGANQCIDCGANHPQWASVTFGALLCLQCSGQHRSLGVQVSCVRSITMDDWSLQDVLTMLEGGNAQLKTFFTRHNLCDQTHSTVQGRAITSENVTLMRYKTKAALFYRQQLEKHVQKVLESWPYRGREFSRRRQQQQQQQKRPLSKANSLPL